MPIRRVASGASPSAKMRRPQVVCVSTNHAIANSPRHTSEPYVIAVPANVNDFPSAVNRLGRSEIVSSLE